jgi:L-asparaginase II
VILEDIGTNPVLAEVVRSGFVESRHRGSFVVLGPDGQVAFGAGATAVACFPRSANKPLQACAMVRAGLDLEGELLALAAASHAGEDFHVDGVRKILSGAGLSEDDLGCPPCLPGDPATKERVLREGGTPIRVRSDCSGKHAAMLATCVRNGWPTATYLDPSHPLQVHIKSVVGELAGEPVAATGVDGCGAPLFALTLDGLARAFRAVLLAPDGSAERKVADAFRAHPEWTSGTKRDEARLMRAVPGLMLKGGAEGVDAFGLPDGRAVALKIDDGSPRGLAPVVVAIMRRMGLTPPAELAEAEVLGGGHPVGTIRPTLP